MMRHYSTDRLHTTRRNVLRRVVAYRAISLLELTMVVAIMGMLAAAAITSYGHSVMENGGAEGFSRKLSLALVHARRSTIATGDNHFLQLSTSGGSVVSYSMIRRASGGDTQVDEPRNVPAGVTVTSADSALEYDFDGSALSAYSIDIAGPDRSWNVAVTMLTGAVQVTETTP